MHFFAKQMLEFILNAHLNALEKTIIYTTLCVKFKQYREGVVLSFDIKHIEKKRQRALRWFPRNEMLDAKNYPDK